MNRFNQCAMILALLLGASIAAAAEKKDDPVWRMSSGSSDGDKTYYTIWCKDKSIGTVIAENDKQRYCAISRGGKQRCDKKWDLTKASVQACRNGK